EGVRFQAAAAFSPDAGAILTGDAEKDPRELLGFTQEANLWDIATGKRLRAFRGNTTSHTCIPTSVAFSADGRFVGMGGAHDVTIVWEVATGTRFRTLHGLGVSSSGSILAFSPDNVTLATGGEHPAVILWDLRAGTPLRVLEGHAGEITALCFSPDG